MLLQALADAVEQMPVPWLAQVCTWPPLHACCGLNQQS